MVRKKVIMKVWTNAYTKQKFVTIPKDSEFSDGDYVEIKKV